MYCPAERRRAAGIFAYPALLGAGGRKMPIWSAGTRTSGGRDGCWLARRRFRLRGGKRQRRRHREDEHRQPRDCHSRIVLSRYRTVANGCGIVMKASPAPDLALAKTGGAGRAAAGGVARARPATSPTGCRAGGCRAGTIMGLVASDGLRWRGDEVSVGVLPRALFWASVREWAQPGGEERLLVNLLQIQQAPTRSNLCEFVG